MKICFKCGKEKLLDSFQFRKDTGKYRNSCKECQKFYFSDRYVKNSSEEKKKRKSHYLNNKDAYKKRSKEWKKNNKDKVKESNKKSYWNNVGAERERCRIKSREYRKNNPEKVKESRKKYKENKEYSIYDRLSDNLRSRFRIALRGNYKTGSAIRDLGCSIEEFKEYLEKKFDSKMSWENYGKYGWHIDHIIPLASFDLTDHEQVKKACHYTNLQPLWAKDNLSKGAKIIT